MPVYEVTIPGSGKFRIDSQSDLDDAAVFRIASGQADQQRMADPTSGMGFTDKFNAGMGKAFTDLGRGAGQLVGLGPTGEEVKETQQLDAPLMQSGAGTAGNIAGNIAAFAPLAVVPGANTVAGAGAIGSIVGGLQPTESTGEKITNMAVGGLLGGGSQYAATTGAKKIGEAAANREAAAKALQSKNAMRDATLREGQAAGYVVPASTVNPSMSNKVIESIAGKDAIKQESSLRNQQVTNQLARKALGLPDDAPISEAALKGLRKTAGQPYRDVSGLSQEASAALEVLKDARHQANAYNKHYRVSADPASLKQAKDYGAAAEALEQRIEQIATQSGRPELVQALRDARKQIAKTWEVENALNVGTGDVSARILGRSLDKGKPLSGELETVGKFANAFDPYVRDGASVPTPGVSKIAALASALMGGGGGAVAGPAGVAAGAIPFVAPPAARSLALSKPYQNMMAKPDYSVGSFTKGAAALADPETRRRAALMARALALPSIPSATPSN
jgi:hypothetical protein